MRAICGIVVRSRLPAASFAAVTPPATDSNTVARRWLPLALALAATLAAAPAAAAPARHGPAGAHSHSGARAHAHATNRHRPHAARLAAPARAADPLRGHASYYAARFHGRRTANGERYDADGFTAAHRTLAFGTRVEVTNTLNQRSVVVQVNERGPMRPGRVIDVSRAAAAELGILASGWAPVTLRIAEGGSTEAPAGGDVSEDSLTFVM